MKGTFRFRKLVGDLLFPLFQHLPDGIEQQIRQGKEQDKDRDGGQDDVLQKLQIESEYPFH